MNCRFVNARATVIGLEGQLSEFSRSNALNKYYHISRIRCSCDGAAQRDGAQPHAVTGKSPRHKTACKARVAADMRGRVHALARPHPLPSA